MNLTIGGDGSQKNYTIDEMVAEEKERCLVFASNNPEIVLPLVENRALAGACPAH